MSRKKKLKQEAQNRGVACTSLYRRRFITTMSKYAATLPVASALLKARTVHAQQRPVRFVALKTFHGNHRDWWVPRTSGGQIPSGTDVDMSTLSLDYADATLRPLHNYRDKLLVLDGLDHAILSEHFGQAGHNGGPTAMTGYGPISGSYGPSIDQIISQGLGNLAGRAMVLGADSEFGGYKTTYFNQNGSGIRPEENAASEYENVFQGFTPPDPGTSNPGDPAVSQNALYSAILNHSATRIQGLRNELTGGEREKLDAHLAGLERLQSQFQEQGGGEMPVPIECNPTAPGGVSGNSTRDSMDGKMSSIAHLIGQAFACDQSRVAGIQIGGDWLFPFPSLEADFHNNVTHNVHTNRGNVSGTLKDRYVEAMRFYSEQFAKLLAMLDVPDPAASEGTILDNTVLYWSNELSCTGQHDDDWMNIPVVIAGGGGGKIRQGRYIRFHGPWYGYTGADASQGTPHNKALTSMAHAVGLSDINYVGDSRAANSSRYQGPLTEIMV